jgi:hypothetical protein
MIKRAFSKAGIKPAETPLSDSEIEDGLDSLNDLLSEWDVNDTLVGVPLLDDVNEVVECPRYADGALKAAIAIRIAGEYNIPVTQAMAVDASASLSAMIAASTDFSDIEFPDTLPIGSGNRDYGHTYENDVFFPRNTKRNF